MHYQLTDVKPDENLTFYSSGWNETTADCAYKYTYALPPTVLPHSQAHII